MDVLESDQWNEQLNSFLASAEIPLKYTNAGKQSEGGEILTIKEERNARYFTAQKFPVLLVILRCALGGTRGWVRVCRTWR